MILKPYKLLLKLKKLLKKKIIFVNILIILVLPLTSLLIFYNFKNLDFTLKLNFFILCTVSIFFTGKFFYKYLVFSKIIKINFKERSIQLRKEILDLKISNKTLIFSLLNFIVFLVLMKYGFLRLSLTFIFFSFFLLIKNIESVKKMIKKSKSDDLKLTLLYKDEYQFIYYFNMIIKFIFILYIWYFCVWVMFLQPALFLKEVFSDSESYCIYIQDNIYYLYYFLILYFNSVLLDFTMESFIIYSHYELFLNFSVGTFIRRGVRVFSFTAGGAATAGVAIAYSPAVEIPGVNSFQIHFGRGYGYKTSLDWTKGMILQSYLKKELMAELIEKHGNKENNLVDGNFYREVMNQNNMVVKILNKNCTPMEQRILGLRTF